MSLETNITHIVNEEQSIRLQRGLGLKWTSDKNGGTMSLSRKGDVIPSSDEVRTVMSSMAKALPPHGVDIDQMTYEVGGHQVIRLYVYWENEND